MEIRTALESDHLRMTLAGRVTLEGSLEALQPALEACRRAGLGAILVDVRAVEGASSVTDRYLLGRAIADLIGPALRIALLCRGDQFMPDRPLENTAVNRGAQFLSTTGEEEALAWLRARR